MRIYRLDTEKGEKGEKAAFVIISATHIVSDINDLRTYFYKTLCFGIRNNLCCSIINKDAAFALRK